MKVFIIKPKIGVNAVGEFNQDTRELTVLPGSHVSADIACSKTFRAATSIAKRRSGTVENGIVTREVPFKSPSTASNFVTGRSTNGLIAWRDSEGRSIKEFLQQQI